MQELRELAKTEEVLFKIDRLLEESNRIDELYRACLKRVAATLKVDRVSLMLIDETRQELFIQETEGLHPEIKAKTRVKLGEGIAGWVAQKGEGVLVHDIDSSRLFHKEKKQEGFRFRSFVSLPIKLRGKVYGVLNVSEKRGGHLFSEEELRTLQIFGWELAILIENQMLYREMAWLEKRPIEQVARISHDFRIPLICVQEAVRIMEKGELGPVTEAQREFLELAKRSLKRLTRNFDELLAITMRIQHEVKREKVEIQPFLEELVSDFELLARRKGVRFELQIPPSVPPVWTERTKLFEVLMNLTDNAVRHTREGTDIQIRVKVKPSTVRIEVHDHGPGIEEERKAILFDKVASLQYCRQRGGGENHGLGLAISYDIVKGLGGKMGFQTRAGHGTTFYVEIPKGPEVPELQAP